MTDVNDNAILFPEPETVEINGEPVSIPPFKLGKALKMLATVAELTDKADLASFVKAASSGEQKFIATLLERLPEMVMSAHPLIPRIAAQVLMPNERYKEVDLNGEDFNAALNPYLDRVYDMDVEQVTDVITAGIESMGLATLKNCLTKLLKGMGSM